MSIRYYVFAPELTGAENGSLKAAGFKALYGALDRICGKIRFRKQQFEVVGTSDLAVEQFAAHIVEQTDKLSEGVIMRLDKKLGHYRNDREPGVIPSNERQSGYLIVTNGCQTDPNSPRTMTQKIMVPFPKEDVSRADIKALAAQQTFGADTASFGKINWNNEAKTFLDAYELLDVAGAGISDYEKNNSFNLVPNDLGLGVDATDPVLDEAA